MFKSKEVFSGILSSTCASNWSLFTSELTSNIPFKIPCITELVQFEVLKKIMFKNTLWKPTDTWFYGENFSIYIRKEAFVFCKKKFVCLFMPSGVHELSLNNTDWILKYFFVHKKPTRKHCNIHRSEMRGYGSSCPWTSLNGHGEEKHGKRKTFKSTPSIHSNQKGFKQTNKLPQNKGPVIWSFGASTKIFVFVNSTRFIYLRFNRNRPQSFTYV